MGVKLKSLVLKAWQSWATRSLAVGGVATLLDIAILLGVIRLFQLPNPVGAAIGVTVGSTFTFFANRHFAFRDRHPELAPQAVKFVLTTVPAMAVHAGLVGLLADRFGVPVVISKLVADVLVFAIGNLLILRYVVFPRQKHLG
jgi:putative flippase GtrA